MKSFLYRTIFLLAVLSPAGAQDPEPAIKSEPAIKVDVEVVNVFCTVHDHRGALIPDLRQDDFKIFEDGRPQQIRYFARETELPLTVALLLDVSGSVRWFVEEEKRTAAKFLEQVLRPN